MNSLNTAVAAAALLATFTSFALEQDPLATLATANPQMTPAPHSMSAFASDALHRIVEARAALHQGDTLTAERRMLEAQDLVEQIQAIRPTTRLADHTWVAQRKLDSEQTEEVALDLIPISISLDDLEDVISAREALRRLVDTREHLTINDDEQADDALSKAHELLGQTEVDLPLASTLARIDKALASIARGDVDGAWRALQEAEAGVRFVTLGNSVPLAKARRELWRSTEAYARSDHAAVEAYLQQAQTWLWAVGPDADPKTRAEAERLHAEITEMLAREKHTAGHAESDIDGFWHRAVALVERQAKALFHTWHDPLEKHHFYRAIIEAKLHLSYAKHELFVRYDAERARAELARTDLYLNEAAAIVPAREAQVASARDDVAALLELSDSPTAELCRRYDSLVAELRDWIEEI